MPPIATSADQGSTGTAASAPVPLWRRVFQGGRQRSRLTPSIRPSHSLTASPNSNNPLPVLEVAQNLSSCQSRPTPTHPGANEDRISSEQKLEPPNWSVVYHPEVEQTLELHLAHAFTYDSEVYCIHMSPDGHRLAVGLSGEGKTYLNELETGSNIWLVSESVFKALG